LSILDWYEEPIAKGHDRKSFDCGEPALNDYLKRHARNSHERGGAKTFLAISREDKKTILGFYSLSPASIEYSRVPGIVKRGLARHDVPVFRLGRLAVNLVVQNRRLGGQFLLSAGRRCILAAAEVGGVAMLIDAKDERVASWYTSYGAVPMLDTPLSLYIWMLKNFSKIPYFPYIVGTRRSEPSISKGFQQMMLLKNLSSRLLVLRKCAMNLEKSFVKV
jgi:hypothetical protein